MKITANNLTVNVPEPSAYVLHKFIICQRRTKVEKKEKDLASAVEIGEYLMTNNKHRVRLKDIFSSLPDKWKKKIINILDKNSKILYEYLQNKA
ncbi:MAG: hypothetical protein A2539_07790 [Elusimicrobia bacterium RIFOXYD2_FULL_34_15]|nr:MAG: hypothetical protein A2539_07790 [Elusimicrobia bacterium RIFOXYD2_FULL_34_15]